MKKVLKAAVFWVILMCVGTLWNEVTLNRTGEGCIQLSDFYKMEEDKVDVLCIGSSHIYYGIHTCRLFDEYGIASYLLASPGQPVWISYYLLEEALKTQKPKAVIFDIGTLFQRDDDFGKYSWETVISMKPSKTKWDAIKAINCYGECLDTLGAFLSFPYYHTRVFSLTGQDYKNTERIRYHGYRPEFGTIETEELEEWEAKQGEYSNKPVAVTKRTEVYLRKIIELCQNSGIHLMLVNSPYANQTVEKQEAGNYIRLVAKEYQIPVIEGNRLLDEMQIEFEDDLLDASHLNYNGSIKYTDYLAKWMESNFNLPDRRGDERYLEWERMSSLLRQNLPS